MFLLRFFNLSNYGIVICNVQTTDLREAGRQNCSDPVSYTHLDVYKRQALILVWELGYNGIVNHIQLDR